MVSCIGGQLIFKDNNVQNIFDKAEELIKEGYDKKSKKLSKKLTSVEGAASIAYFRLGQIHNRNNSPLKSYLTFTPTNLGKVLTESNPGYYLETRLNQLRNFGEIINHLKSKANGDNLLEIGVGSGTMLAVAMEYGFNVSGIDIRPSYTKAIKDLLGENIISVDFLDFNTDQKYDVICMGDVLEHFEFPVKAIKKVNSLLNNNGLLWISTPNFESAFTRIKKDKDPMWRTTQHINYFSYDSLEKVLNENGFEILEYKMSKNYNGSLEVTPIKK